MEQRIEALVVLLLVMYRVLAEPLWADACVDAYGGDLGQGYNLDMSGGTGFLVESPHGVNLEVTPTNTIAGEYDLCLSILS